MYTGLKTTRVRYTGNIKDLLLLLSTESQETPRSRVGFRNGVRLTGLGTFFDTILSSQTCTKGLSLEPSVIDPYRPKSTTVSCQCHDVVKRYDVTSIYRIHNIFIPPPHLTIFEVIDCRHGQSHVSWNVPHAYCVAFLDD